MKYKNSSNNKEQYFWKKIKIPNLIALRMAQKYGIKFDNFDKDLKDKIITDRKDV